MDDVVRSEILSLAHQAHHLTETAYQADAATRGAPGWGEKQRILLADMALHLVQTAMRDGPLSEEHLKRNLFAILTISDQFLPESELKLLADKL